VKDKLLILGFDGTSPDLLTKWMESGELPVLKDLVGKGAFGTLRSVPNMSSPPAWTSFATGKNPGKHGIFRFTERNFSNYQYKYVNAAFRRSATFWELLCGKRIGCVVNVPMTYPVDIINGCMIAGFDAPDIESEGVCYPTSLIEELNTKVDPYVIIRDSADMLRKGAQFDQAAGQMLESMELRYRHMSYLMDKYEWELFTVVFNETDHAQHFFWKFTDPGHPDYDESQAAEYGDLILKIYKKMDEITGRLIAENPDVTVILMSDHGGGINTRGAELVSDWLQGLGLLAREEQEATRAKGFLNRTVIKMAKHAYNFANRRLSTKTKLKLIKAFPSMRERVESAIRLGGIDWSGTKAYCDGAQDDIWINLAGRDPLGIVQESEYDELCDFICRELKNAVDVTTGEPIVDSAFRRADAYSGNYVERASDITICWKPKAVITGIKTESSPSSLKAAKFDWPRQMCTGGHSMDGVFIAAGPRIKKDVRLKDAQILDIAPTVMYIFGEEIPVDMDGMVIEEIFEASYYQDNPPKYGSSSESDAGEEDIYSEEDSSVIEQRLRDLGYI